MIALDQSEASICDIRAYLTTDRPPRELIFFILRLHAPSTILWPRFKPTPMRNLRSQWKSFLRFCEQFTFAALPASPQTLSAYVSFLSCKTSSFNYVMNHLNAARLFHLYKGFSTESFNSFTVSLTKKGLKRTMGSSPCQKHPITPDILVSMRCSLDLTTPSHAALWALFMTAFFSFLRKSNLVAASASSFNSDQHLARHDIKFTDSDSHEGVHIIPLPSIPNSSLCPVSAIRHYFTLVPAPSVAPFFCLPTDRRPGFIPLPANYFTSSLKRLIVSLGLDPANYSPHSFRRGGATYACQAGVPEHLIKLHGDWRSDAYQVYLSLPLSTRAQVADIMAAGLFTNA